MFLAAATTTLADVHYVDLNSTNATPPYTNWTTAARNIQDAVDAAIAGDEVVVTNGVYATGGRNSNRVEVDKPLALRSVNGPHFTVISGARVARCAYLTNGASLSGFTLMNGFGYFYPGGGAYGGILNHCILTSNSVSFTSHIAGTIQLFGGGAAYSTLNDCALTSNSVSLTNTPVAEARSQAYGGGAYQCTLNNCTVSGNLASAMGTGALAAGGGTWSCVLNNCVSFGNDIATGPNPYCVDCYSPGILAGNNWYGDPFFVDYGGGDLRLQSSSPCINAGSNSYLTNSDFTNSFDLDGNPRISGGTVDIGAYEFQSPASMISYAWLQQYGLPINNSTDTADPDGDGVDNYHEWLGGTDPTNPLSSPAQLTITPSGVPPTGIILTWSTNAVGFTLQSTTNPLSQTAWVTSAPAPVVINGQNTVTNPITSPQRLYRLIH